MSETILRVILNFVFRTSFFAQRKMDFVSKERQKRNEKIEERRRRYEQAAERDQLGNIQVLRCSFAFNRPNIETQLKIYCEDTCRRWRS